MRIKKESIINLLLFLVGVFCLVDKLMPRGLQILYLSICLFLFIISMDFKKLKLKIGFLWYFLFVIFVILSLFYTINKINPSYVYTRIGLVLIVLSLVSPFLDNEENVKTIVKGFLIGGLFAITFVLIKQHNLIGIERLGRGPYGSYAEFGSVCSLSLSAFIWLQRYYKNNKFIKTILFLYLSMAVILSGARKAMLIVILIPLLMQLFDRRKKIGRKLFTLLIISISSLVIVFVTLNNAYLYKFIGYRIESGLTAIIGEDKEDASLYDRNSFKILAKEMFKERPILGWGIHSFALQNYYLHANSSYYFVFSHDGFLEILSCYGIAGFIIYYWVFVYIIINFKKLLYDDTGIFLFTFIIIILMMEPYGISFYNRSYILLIAAAANILGKRRKENEKNTKENIGNNTGQIIHEN